MELKLRVEDYRKIEHRLDDLGAKFIQELNVVDTYFNQPKGKVLKIEQDERGNFISKLEAHKGRFKILESKKVKNIEKEKNHLKEKFGIKAILKKKRRQWELGDTLFDFNLIENVGDFLILNSENPHKSTVTDLLGIKNPEYITVSFDELKK